MLTMKELNAKIGSIRKSVAALRVNIHEVLCNAAGHAYEHGDVTAFTRLFAAVPGADRQAIGRWVAEFGFAKLSKDGTFSLNKAGRKNADFDDGDAVVDYLLSHVDPWYAYVKSGSQVAADLDVEKQVNSLIKRIKKARSEGDRDVIVPFGTRRAVAELGDLIGSIQNERHEETTTTEAAEGSMRDVTPQIAAIAAE